MVCSNCGKELNDDAKFCTNCGTKVEKANDIYQPETSFDDGAEKNVDLPEEKAPAVTADEMPADDLSDAPAETDTDFLEEEKTILPDEEPADTDMTFLADENTVLPEEEAPKEQVQDFIPVQPEPPVQDYAPVQPEPPVQDYAPVQPEPPVQDYAPVQPEPPVQNYAPVQPEPPVQNYSQQTIYGGYGNPDMGAVPPVPMPMPVPEQKAAPVKVGKGRIFGASVVAFFAIILLLAVSMLTCLKLGLSGKILRNRVEDINLNTVFNAELDGKDVSENLYNSLGFGTVTHGNASAGDLKDYIKESDFLEYAGENIENYADYILSGKGKDPSITAEDITYDFFAENNDAAEDVFGYELRKDDLKTIRKNLEKEGVDEALSVNEWEKKMGVDPKNISYIVSYIMIGIVAALVLILLIWIVIIVDKTGRHVMSLFGNIMFISGLVVFLCGAAVTAGSMIAFSLTSNVVFYLASNILLPFGILALIVGFAELVIGLIFKKIGKALKNKKKLADARKPVNQNPVPAMMYN